MDLFQNIEPIIQGHIPTVLTAVIIYAAKLARDISRSLQELNTRIAVIIEKVDSHEKRLTRLEDSK